MTERLPMLAIPSTGASRRDAVKIESLVDGSGAYVLDTKHDGERAFVRHGRIINRLGLDITAKFPEIEGPDNLWLDGEIVPMDNQFETVLYRGSLSNSASIRRAAATKPCMLIAFDLLEVNDQQHWHRPWRDRRVLLEEHARHHGIATTVTSATLSLWESTRKLGMEGVIAKRANARYQFGKRSADWVKFKHLHRVSCIAVGYTPGNGSREHMGAIQLSLIGPNGPVPVGRAGSGFTAAQTHEIKQRIDGGEFPVVEIECTHVTSGGTLRFPVFRGYRNDVQIIDCTTDQLAALPRTKE